MLLCVDVTVERALLCVIVVSKGVECWLVAEVALELATLVGSGPQVGSRIHSVG